MRKTLAALMLTLALISCKNSNPDLNGNDQTMRIISLAPSITKDLQTLGLTENIVGATSFCEVAKKNKSLVVGSAVDINMEKILLLKPSIVFVSTLAKPSTIATLKKNGINVYQVEKVNDYAGMCSEFARMAKTVGKEKVANKIIADAKAKLEVIKAGFTHHQAKKRVFFQIGTNPVFSVLSHTFMDDFITLSDCENIAAGLTAGTVTREFVLTQNPDVIIITTMGIAGEEEKKVWETYPDLNAVKNHKIIIVDSDKACSPSVVSFIEILQQINDSIWKPVF